MIVQKVTKTQSNNSGCIIILMSKVCCMRGGASILINRAHIILFTGMLNDIVIKVVKMVKIYLSRLLTKESREGEMVSGEKCRV